MTLTRVFVRRMTTSRDGPTKYEHFVTAQNTAGRLMDFWMHHEPTHALVEATMLANFAGLQVEPLVIDGVMVELDEIDKMMCEIP